MWHLCLAHIAKCKTHITISETAGAASETGLGFVWEGQGYIYTSEAAVDGPVREPLALRVVVVVLEGKP